MGLCVCMWFSLFAFLLPDSNRVGCAEWRSKATVLTSQRCGDGLTKGCGILTKGCGFFTKGYAYRMQPFWGVIGLQGCEEAK